MTFTDYVQGTDFYVLSHLIFPRMYEVGTVISILEVIEADIIFFGRGGGIVPWLGRG